MFLDASAPTRAREGLGHRDGALRGFVARDCCERLQVVACKLRENLPGPGRKEAYFPHLFGGRKIDVSL
jgi:hypothetical protein